MARHFFFYGTLRHDVAQGLPTRLVEGLEVLGAATVAGRIFAKHDPRGTYPVLQRGGIGRVHGTVCRASERFSIRNLAAMDRFEGAAGRGGEYVRRPLQVLLDGGATLTADAYVYNRQVTPALTPIPHGDFARYLAETGLAPYGG
ncbi:MAG: gamma-glutamylcyclotransferase [Proteobacteria bacterium]|nr:gamma-glutamylcyclotransferase [Pseudomonadota bacterium]